MTEGLLVLFGISYPLLYQPDQFCATRLKSNLNVRYIEEGRAVVQSNTAGFVTSNTKCPNRKEPIASPLLGDSFCEALSIDLHMTILEVVGTGIEFSGTSGRSHDLWNLRFGTAQAVQCLNTTFKISSPTW